MNTRIFVRLRFLSSSRGPEVLTRLIGLECDHSWRIGDKRCNTQIVESKNGWLLFSGLLENASLDEHIASLFGRVMPVEDRIIALPHDITVEVSCAIYAEHPPALFFAADVVNKMARIRASFDIDLYML